MQLYTLVIVVREPTVGYGALHSVSPALRTLTLSLSQPMDMRTVRGLTIPSVTLVDITLDELTAALPDHAAALRNGMRTTEGSFYEVRTHA